MFYRRMFIDAAACIEISPQRGAYGLLTVNSLFLCSIFDACCLIFGQMREFASKEILRTIILRALCWPIFLIKIQKWIFRCMHQDFKYGYRDGNEIESIVIRK